MQNFSFKPICLALSGFLMLTSFSLEAGKKRPLALDSGVGIEEGEEVAVEMLASGKLMKCSLLPVFPVEIQQLIFEKCFVPGSSKTQRDLFKEFLRFREVSKGVRDFIDSKLITPCWSNSLTGVKVSEIKNQLIPYLAFAQRLKAITLDIYVPGKVTDAMRQLVGKNPFPVEYVRLEGYTFAENQKWKDIYKIFRTLTNQRSLLTLKINYFFGFDRDGHGVLDALSGCSFSPHLTNLKHLEILTRPKGLVHTVYRLALPTLLETVVLKSYVRFEISNLSALKKLKTLDIN